MRIKNILEKRCISFIKDREIKEYIKNSKKLLRKKEYKECSINIAKAFYIFNSKTIKELKREGLNSFNYLLSGCS